METVIAKKIDESFYKITAEYSVLLDISEFFKYRPDGYAFSPKYKAGIWDGWLKMFSTRDRKLPVGLLLRLKSFCDERRIEFVIDKIDSGIDVSLDQIKRFYEENDLPFEPKPHQTDALIEALREKRITLLSPTASGKSFIIYLIHLFLRTKSLIILPRIDLVTQTINNFKKYGYDVNLIHDIKNDGQDHEGKRVVVTTWQAIYKKPREWFESFETVFVDEVHGFPESRSLKTILENCYNASWRIGTTGTIHDSRVHEMILEALIGPVYKVTTTHELQKSGDVANIQVYSIRLKYPESVRRMLKDVTGDKKIDYSKEIDYILASEKRMKILSKLAVQCKGVTLVLFRYKEKHGLLLYDAISKLTDRECFYISGDIKSEDRSKIQEYMQTVSDCIAVASYGTYAEGIDIPNINNVIIASPMKSRVKNLQAVGRGLRISTEFGKDKMALYDVIDDISWGNKKNHAYKHGLLRLKSYEEEKFPVKKLTIEM